jgi:hypothetical protein
LAAYSRRRSSRTFVFASGRSPRRSRIEQGLAGRFALG